MQKHGEHKRKWTAWSAAMMKRLQDEKGARANDQAAARIVIEGLRTEAKDLRDALANGVQSMPPATIAAYFETEAVADALDKRDSAFRLRDMSMQTLWRIDQRHHAESEKKQTCSCGNSTCDLPRLIADEVITLRRWEANQEARAKDGKDHHLPEEHPTARKYPPRRGWSY
jgi:hypothetical protein